ncbi:MAG: hypothetical protein JZU65_14040, partial [Chlorobium sp.]|nr:hypothetical protein [Chlorobium sp.]
MEKLIKEALGKDYIPSWISLATAFSCLQELLEKSSGEYALLKGEVDDVRLREKRDLPDALKMYCLREDYPEALEWKEKCLVKADEALRARLADGTVGCQGRFRQTVRTLKIIDDRDFRKGLEHRDHYRTDSEHKSVNQHLWEKNPWVNYRKSEIAVWEMDEEDLHTDISQPDNCFINIECTMDGLFIESGQDYIEHEVIWREDWTDLQVCTSELLRSTDMIFSNNVKAQHFEKELSATQDYLKSTGINRFYYSSVNTRWIVEFQYKVFFLVLKPNSSRALTVKYLLENGSTDADKAAVRCRWLYLYGIGSKYLSPNPQENFDLNNEDGFFVGSYSFQGMVDPKRAKELKKEWSDLRIKLNEGK